jgi:hypothetical protein
MNVLIIEQNVTLSPLARELSAKKGHPFTTTLIRNGTEASSSKNTTTNYDVVIVSPDTRITRPSERRNQAHRQLSEMKLTQAIGLIADQKLAGLTASTTLDGYTAVHCCVPDDLERSMAYIGHNPRLNRLRWRSPKLASNPFVQRFQAFITHPDRWAYKCQELWQLADGALLGCITDGPDHTGVSWGIFFGPDRFESGEEIATDQDPHICYVTLPANTVTSIRALAFTAAHKLHGVSDGKALNGAAIRLA